MTKWLFTARLFKSIFEKNLTIKILKKVKNSYLRQIIYQLKIKK